MRYKSGIYMILCAANGKMYVGSSINIVKRWKRHRYQLNHNKHDSRHLQNAWNKYGSDTFEWSILESIQIDGLTIETTKSVLCLREQYHIDRLPRAMLFNAHLIATSNLGNKHTEETKRKIAASSTGRKLSAEAKNKIAIANIGKKCSAETRAKIAAASQNQSPETRAKNAAAQVGNKRTLGMKHTKEAKAKIALAGTDKKHTEETKIKIAKTLCGRAPSNKGKPMPEAQKTKLSLAYRQKQLASNMDQD